jgi:periplasmic protein CpxP/Spy
MQEPFREGRTLRGEIMGLNASRIWAGVVRGTVLLAGVAAGAEAVQAGHFHKTGFVGGGMQLLLHRLDLSDAQKAQIRQIMTNEKPTLQPLLQQLSRARQQHRQLVESAAFDEAQVRAWATQQSQTITELTVERARIESEMYQVLTADQKTKLNQMLDQQDQRRLQHGQPQSGSQQ